MQPASDTPDPIVAKALALTLVILEMEKLAAQSVAAERAALLLRVKAGRAIVKRALGTVQGSAA